MPEQKDLDAFYEGEYYSSARPNYLKEYEEDIDWWSLCFESYYKEIERNCNSNSKKLLEVGSGPGIFLKVGKDRGWDVVGFEPSKHAYEFSRRFVSNVINDSFNVEAASKLGLFDVVCMRNVIEHVEDPEKMLKDVKSVIKPGGLFFIITPNDYNPLQLILKEKLEFKPYWVAPPQHINYFNFKSIKMLLKRLNFEIIKPITSSEFPMEFFLLSGDNYVNNNELGRQCHVKRKELEKNLYKYDESLLKSIYHFFADKEIGREFIIFAKSK